MKNKLLIRIVFFTIAVWIMPSLISCKKNFLEKSPITELSGDVLKNETDFTALVNSAYDPMQWQVYNGAQTHMFPVMWQDIRADNCISQWAAYWTYGAVLDDLRNIKPNNTNISAMWRKWFTAIARANTAIKFVTDFNGFTTPGHKDRLLAEAKFVRAFSYFELVKHFGNVPLITAYIGSTGDQLKFPRAPIAQVYSQIEKDLTEAFPVLPKQYTGVDKGRATMGAALTLLAKAELYQKKYDKVKEYTEMVMALGYVLEPNFADNFDQNNNYGKESIFEIGYLAGIYNNPFEASNAYKNQGSASYKMFGFIPAGTGVFGNCVPRQQLIDLYDNADKRKDATFIVPSTFLPDLGKTAYDAGTQYYQYYWTDSAALVSQASVRKYYIPFQVGNALPGDKGSDGLNEKIFRYADVLLMHAEASVMGAGGDGLGSLNQVIARAYGNSSHNLASYTLSDVKLQRRLELATEGWDRFTDLVRWGDAASALAFKHFTTGRDELLPIPQSEIDLVGSQTLLQNPGY
jgi:hypothetical protein